MITTAFNHESSNRSVHPTQADDVIYEPGNLPEGLIDLPTASRKYGIKCGHIAKVDPARETT